MAQDVKPGGVFMINCQWSDEELAHHLNAEAKKYIADNNIQLYTINAIDKAIEIGMGKRTNTILQSAFFKLANVMPIDDAVEFMKAAAKKSYGKKGDAVVEMNYKAIDAGVDAVHKVEVPASWSNPEADPTPKELTGRPETVKMVRDLMEPISKMDGDSLPVSAFAKNPDGQPIAQVTDEYQTLIIQLPDDRFSALSDVGFAENMLIRNIGAYEKTLYIDEIYFTNTVPTEHVEVTWNDNNTIPEDAIYIEDGRRDTFALPFGDVKLNYVNGSKASFVNEVTPIPDDSAFSMADGVVTYHAALDNGLSMSLGENYYENYKYIVFRAKAAAGAGDKFAVKLGSNAAQEILFKDLKFSADNYAKELSGEWQDIYVSTDAALNGLNNMPYLKFLGKGEADIQIDCIYMTNTVPEGYEAGRAVEQQGGNDGDKDDGKDDGKDPADKPITETGVALPIGVAVLAAGAAGALVITRRRKNAK